MVRTMHCIFCKLPSSNSKGQEHIVPQSLGNTEHVLRPGIVCDKCNNYFASKVEGKVLNSSHFKNLRGRQGVYSKKNKVPFFEALMLGEKVRMQNSHEGKIVELSPVLFEKIKSAKTGQIIIPMEGDFNKKLFSRFLAKIGLEILTSRICDIPGWESEIIHNEALDEIRNFARFDRGPQEWPFHSRRIYDENAYGLSEDGERYQVVHEQDIVATESWKTDDGISGTFYAVVCIFGVEYAINLSEPTTDSYIEYLKINNGQSPLYKNSPLPQPPDEN